MKRSFGEAFEPVGGTVQNVASISGNGAHSADERRIKTPATDTELAERRHAERLRKHGLRGRAQAMIDESQATRDAANGSSSPAANGYPIGASDDTHACANLLYSPSSATVEETPSRTSDGAHEILFSPMKTAYAKAFKPDDDNVQDAASTIQKTCWSTSDGAGKNPLLARLQERQGIRATDTTQQSNRRRLHKKTTVPHYDSPTSADGFQRKAQDTRSETKGSNAESAAATSSGSAHGAAEQTLRDVLDFGCLPREFKNPVTEAEVAEQRLALRVRWHQLRR